MNKSDIRRDFFMLKGPLSKKGYDWWWHNFTGYNRETGEAKAFFIEYFVCNPALGGKEAILGQLPANQEKQIKPSYALIKAGAWGKNAKQIHKFYPIDNFSCPIDALDVKMSDCTLSETHMKGKCAVTAQEVLEHPEYMCDAGEMSWDITINKKIAYNVGYGASKFFRTLNLFEMFWRKTKVKFDFSEGEKFNTWSVNSSNKDSIMELTLQCPKDEMLLINYESPSGHKRHNRLWNGGTGFGEIKLYKYQNREKILIDHIEIKNAGCEYGEYSFAK